MHLRSQSSWATASRFSCRSICSIKTTHISCSSSSFQCYSPYHWSVLLAITHHCLLTRFFLQFFTLQLVQNLTMLFGPIAHYHENSRYYSAVPPKPNKELDAALPHITIQMPVYKEGLDAVLWVSPRLSDSELPNDQNQNSVDRITQTCHANLRPTRWDVFYIRE